MTLGATRSAVVFQGDGEADEFPVTIPFLDVAHLRAEVKKADGTRTALTAGTDFAWVLERDEQLQVRGATLRLPEPLAAGDTLTVKRLVPLTQECVFTNQGPNSPRVMEDALDRLTMIAQQLDGELDDVAHRVDTLDGMTPEHPVIRELTAGIGALATALEAKAPGVHAERHAGNGADPLRASDIGALDDGHLAAENPHPVYTLKAETQQLGVVRTLVTVHVAPGGSDDASGTTTDPFATPGGAFAAAVARTPGFIRTLRINIAAGEYAGNMALYNAGDAAVIGSLEVNGALAANPSATVLNLTQALRTGNGLGNFTIANCHLKASMPTAYNIIDLRHYGTFAANKLVIESLAASNIGRAIDMRPGISGTLGGIAVVGRFDVVYGLTGSRLTSSVSSDVYSFRAGRANLIMSVIEDGFISFRTVTPTYGSDWVMGANALSAASGGKIYFSTARLAAWLNGAAAIVEKAPASVSYISGITN